MATFERLPSGRWRARIEVRGADGRRRRVSRTAATKRELQTLVADVQLNGAPSSSSTTLAELFEAWRTGPAAIRPADRSSHRRARRSAGGSCAPW